MTLSHLKLKSHTFASYPKLKAKTKTNKKSKKKMKKRKTTHKTQGMRLQHFLFAAEARK